MSARRRFALAIPVLLLGAAALAWAVWRLEAPTPRGEAAAAIFPDRSGAAPAAASDAASAPSPERRAEIEFAETALAEARSRHELAVHALESARADMAGLEDDVASLERYVEALEARGEDPADHAFEGMERFRPVLAKYQTLMAAYDRAEQNEREAREAVEAAERALQQARQP
jgi:hypothetical protein